MSLPPPPRLRPSPDLVNGAPAPPARRCSAPRRPRILIVTPEVASIPPSLSPRAWRVGIKAGGLADVAAALVDGLERRGTEVHLAVPNYRRLFEASGRNAAPRSPGAAGHTGSIRRLHLAEDRVFYYRSQVYGGPEAGLAAMALQREVINHVIPAVRPDLIHCHDWMTGLIPAFARSLGIPSVFTMHNVHTERLTLAALEDRGIDTAAFWQDLYYERMPHCYEETRSANACDLAASGILAADRVTVVSPGFLSELTRGDFDFVPPTVRHALRTRAAQGRAVGIVNCPPADYNPATDPHLAVNYDPRQAVAGKRENKLSLQRELGLAVDPAAPLLFWPSRLDPFQKGCQLLTEILFQTLHDYRGLGLQFVSVANGPFHQHLCDIARMHRLGTRLVAAGFSEAVSRRAFAAADFILMPSLFEPCGLAQTIGTKYGALAIVRATGGLRDTIQPLDPERQSGNGFPFDNYDAQEFRGAIDRALRFFQLSPYVREREVIRIMTEAGADFNERKMLSRYFSLFEETLRSSPNGAVLPNASQS